jgi:putative ABC transport system permease protein
MLYDLRFALRLLTKNLGTTLAAVVALGFGIGLSTAIFNAYSAILLRPLPHIRDEDRLVFLNSVSANQPDNFYNLSMPDFLDLRTRAKTIEGLTTAQDKTVIFGARGSGAPERALGADVSVEGFAMLGVPALRGRLFTPADAAPDAPPVALLSYALWQRRYGGRDDVLGRVETLNGTPTTIIGVLPAGFGFPENGELWLPMRTQYLEQKERASHSWNGWARLRDGVSLDEARAEIAGIAAALQKEYPVTNANKNFAVRLVRDEATDDSKVFITLMLGGAISVLLIACANVANLLLAHATRRTHELAIRVSVGATRLRLARQMLTECVLLGLLGGGFGLLVASWANGLILAAIPDVVIPFWVQLGFDWRIFVFAASAALLSSLLFGLFPALQASRHTALDLKEGSRSATGSRRSRAMRHALVITQIALSAVLLISTGLFVRSFMKMHAQPLGFEPAGVLTFRVGLPQSQFTSEETRRFFEQLSPRLHETPGVIAAGAISHLPGNDGSNNAFVIEGQPEPATIADAPFTNDRIASPGYFSALRIPLLRGRLLNASDTRQAPLVCVIDQQFARRWFGDRDPLGARIRFGLANSPKAVWLTIVGIVGDVPQKLNNPNDRGSVYRALEQNDINFVNYAVRVQGDPATFGPRLQKAVLSVRPDIPIYNVLTLERVQANAYWNQRFMVQVFSAFGLGALFLASLGVYSVMTYSVAQRTPEIGVRMALGASETDVFRLVGRQGFVLVCIGLAIGLASALLVSRLLASLLFQISPTDPPTYFALTGVLATVGLVACWLPARRATRVDPLTALRSE